MIFLLHIPKTGGQTLATRLAAGFPPGRCSILQADVPDAAALARLAASHDFFEGHPGPAVLREPPPGLRVMAALRDPVEQAISHYRHMRRDARHPLHGAARSLAPAAFLDRFTGHMFNFQARTLVAAFRAPAPAERVRGVELWLLRHLEEALDGLRWVAPSERLDEFCALWRLETGRPLAGPELRVNVAPAEDGVDAGALRRWLHANADRFAVDSLLWGIAGRRYADWRHGLLTRAGGDGGPPEGLRAWSAGEGDGAAAVWLTRDWHPPALRADGVTEWWAGPGLYPLLRVRRGGRARLRFEAAAFLGVRWDRIRLLRRADLSELPLRRAPLDDATEVVRFDAAIDGLGEEELVLYGPEDVTVLPALPAAYEIPRRGFATQNWRLE